MSSIDTAVLDGHGEISSDATPLLRHLVRTALESYLLHLDGQTPAKLYQMVLKEVEPSILLVVMQHTKNNQSKAAKYLGLSRTTLRKKLKLYDLG
jgi:Fis family transcriptional regulator